MSVAPQDDDIDSMLNSIRSALGGFVRMSYTPTSKDYDIFEGYVFGLVRQAAADEGATITYQDFRGATTRELRFRTSPGEIYRGNYTHALFEFTGKQPLEMHLGIFVQGSSGARHESDIAVITQAEGIACRLNRSRPRASQLTISIECKYRAASLGISYGREFIGLTSDLINSRDRFFITNVAAGSLEALLSRHGRTFSDMTMPSSPNDERRIQGMLQNAFRKYKASR